MSQDKVILTPSKRGNTTVLRIDRASSVKNAPVYHEGQGVNRGLIINEQKATPEPEERAQLQLEFKCWLINSVTGDKVPESRQLKFWFKQGASYLDKVSLSYDFFRELVQPDQFPRDYLNFVKNCMKQLQSDKFALLSRIDVELTPLDSTQEQLIQGLQETDSRSREEKLRDQVLFLLESAYPNILELDDLAKIMGITEAEVQQILEELASRGLVKRMDDQRGGWTRRVQMDEATAEEEPTIVIQQMPTLSNKQQPSIAVITSNYYEKLAVDAMMEEKTTYVKFQAVGDAHVYTLGYIGDHRVVSTKLPQIGRGRGAQISAGNNTTRLLGTFDKIEHVFMVGGAGGVPHYTDYYKHVRLGDVVMSTPNDKGHIYVFCEKLVEDRKTHEISYQLKTYAPKDPCIQERVGEIRDYCYANPAAKPWVEYIHEGQAALRGQEASFERPPPDTDKLFMHLGDDNVLEVAHPQPPQGAHNDSDSNIHFGPVGSGRSVIRGATARQEFAYKHGIQAFDKEFDQVLDSIIGNVKYSFAIIRGIVDYADGTSNAAKRWLPYAALASAAYMKTVIRSMPNI
ncbi:uncharacterized protein [Watersipora subatra]|uniref:uncharacterized protein n=1 Tax=Watersipora subatra TaxID=2589382 RepID=UPI00355B5D48